MTIIQTGRGDGWGAAEKQWVATYREIGASLTNATDGGEGTPGLRPGSETRAKMSAAHKGRRHTAAARQQISLMLKGRKQSEVHVAKLSAARKGKAPLAATKAAAEKIRGTRQSAEHVAKRMASSDHRKLAARRLSDDAVRAIRAGGASQRALAKRFAVGPTCVHSIQNRRTYRDVPEAVT